MNINNIIMIWLGVLVVFNNDVVCSNKDFLIYKCMLKLHIHIMNVYILRETTMYTQNKFCLNLQFQQLQSVLRLHHIDYVNSLFRLATPTLANSPHYP